MIKLHSKKSLFIVLNSLLISMFYFFFNCTSNEDEAEGSLLNMPNIRVEASILNNNQIPKQTVINHNYQEKKLKFDNFTGRGIEYYANAGEMIRRASEK